jgi:hypothetical protein
MTDVFTAFTPPAPMFQDGSAQPAQEAPKKQRGRPRKAKQPAGSAVQQVQAPEAPKVARGRRKAATGPSPAAKLSEGCLRVPMSALVGISADEITLLEKMATAVQALPRKRRLMVATALGRIFA